MDVSPVTQLVLHYSFDQLRARALEDIGTRLPTEFLSTLSEPDATDALRACLIVHHLSSQTIVPRAFQLQATLATLRGIDTIVIAGTGSGKTLCQLIPLLLRPGTLTITISPLKRLQVTQVLECEKYNIKTIAINEDTPNDSSLWESIRTGYYQHLIVSPEQLGMYNGHLPRLARLLRQDRMFAKKIQRVHIDEAHNIYTSGRSHHGEDAFRPAYGRLAEFRAILPAGIPIQALSATLPPHMHRVVQCELGMGVNHVAIHLSTNHPNITYATSPIIGSLRDFRNFNCLIPPRFHPPMEIPKTLVFHDSKQDATDAARYTISRLPKALRDQGIVRHYHSNMSTEYLQQTYEDFSNPNGRCRILHATAGASTGLDIRGVRIVIQYGVCTNLTDLIQRAGRAVRDPTLCGLFVLMYEPWVLDIELPNQKLDAEDPDRPHRSGGTIGKKSSKQNRTGHAMIQLIQSTTCIREFLGNYLHDCSPSARHYTALYCCDRHADSNFKLSTFFLGDMYTGQLSEEGSTATKRKRTQYRAIEDRPSLFDALLAWRDKTYDCDPEKFARSATWSIDDIQLDLLSKIHPSDVNSPQDITSALQETPEWAAEFSKQIFNAIRTFDRACVKKALHAARLAKRTRELIC